MEPSGGKKRKRSSHGKERKAYGNTKDFETSSSDVDSRNKVPSTTNESTGSKKEDDCWPAFLSEAELDLLVSIKNLAVERFTSIEEECLQEILPASVLQTIGILMKELVKDHVRKLVGVHKSSQASEASQGSTEDFVREV